MAFETTFQTYCTYAIIVDDIKVQDCIRQMRDAAFPEWKLVQLTSIISAKFPEIIAQFEYTSAINAATKIDILFSHANGVLEIAHISASDNSEIIPPIYNQAVLHFNNKIKNIGYQIMLQDGAIQLSRLFGNDAIGMLRHFEALHHSKDSQMTANAAKAWKKFHEQVRNEGAVGSMIEYQTDILRDCCGFTNDNAYDFTMKYGFH